jgi:hypothetical protein
MNRGPRKKSLWRVVCMFSQFHFLWKGECLFPRKITIALLEAKPNDHCMTKTLQRETRSILKFWSLLNPAEIPTSSKVHPWAPYERQSLSTFTTPFLKILIHPNTKGPIQGYPYKSIHILFISCHIHIISRDLRPVQTLQTPQNQKTGLVGEFCPDTQPPLDSHALAKTKEQAQAKQLSKPCHLSAA